MYRSVVVLVTLIAASLALTVQHQGRVINGTDAEDGTYRYMVSVRYNKNHICGGGLLNDRFAITAAHCVFNREIDKLSIQFGVVEISEGDDTNVKSIGKVIVHELFYAKYESVLTNDLALLKLASPLPKHNQHIQFLSLPLQDEDAFIERATFAGWGYNTPSSLGNLTKRLQHVALEIYSNKDCEDSYGDYVNRKYHFCAGVPGGDTGACFGDDGGPLVNFPLLIGVMSWAQKPCALIGFPDVHVRVSSYARWVQKHMRDV